MKFRSDAGRFLQISKASGLPKGYEACFFYNKYFARKKMFAGPIIHD